LGNIFPFIALLLRRNPVKNGQNLPILQIIFSRQRFFTTEKMPTFWFKKNLLKVCVFHISMAVCNFSNILSNTTGVTIYIGVSTDQFPAQNKVNKNFFIFLK